MGQQRIQGCEREISGLKNLPVDTPLYATAIEHDGTKGETAVRVTKFLLKEYEAPPENQTEIELSLDVDYVTIVDERFPNIPIKHQALASFHLTERDAVESMYEGIAHAENVMAKYIVANYGVAVLNDVRVRIAK
jgi:hypothetical protein